MRKPDRMILTKAFVVGVALVLGQQIASGQFVNSRDLKQDPDKLKRCMASAGVTQIGEFEINLRYIESVRQRDPDRTFVLSHNSLVECGMNSGTGKYGWLFMSGETSASWHLIRPPQFKPGLATPEGQNMAIKACGEAAKARLNRPNFDHYSFFMAREVEGPSGYTAQQEANLWSGRFHTLTDRGLSVAPYDIEVTGTEFYKNGSLDLTGVSVLCLFNPMLEIKAIKTKDVKDSPPPTARRAR